MWHEITINADSASDKLDALVEFINWMSDMGKGSNLSVSDRGERYLTVSFLDEGESSTEDWRRMIDESWVFDGYDYEIK